MFKNNSIAIARMKGPPGLGALLGAVRGKPGGGAPKGNLRLLGRKLPYYNF